MFAVGSWHLPIARQNILRCHLAQHGVMHPVCDPWSPKPCQALALQTLLFFYHHCTRWHKILVLADTLLNTTGHILDCHFTFYWPLKPKTVQSLFCLPAARTCPSFFHWPCLCSSFNKRKSWEVPSAWVAKSEIRSEYNFQCHCPSQCQCQCHCQKCASPVWQWMAGPWYINPLWWHTGNASQRNQTKVSASSSSHLHKSLLWGESW